MSKLELQHNKHFFQSSYFHVSVILLLFVLGWWSELLNLRAINFTGGDGGKNQFAFLDYVLHGDGLMAYGMNYPFGEHITFTDNQPPLAILIQFIHNHIFSLDKHALSIHNFWVLFQIPLAAIAFYYFLRNVVSNATWAFIGALLIVYLSPQLMRLHTHFSLAYMFIYGAAFNCLWMIIKQKKQRRYAIILFAIAFVGGFTHLYNFIGVLLFAGFATLFGLLFKFINWKQTLNIILPLALAGGIIIFLVQGLDPFPLRPKTAEGLFHYSSTFEGTIFPFFGKEAAWFHSLFPSFFEPNWEGRNFLGFVAILLNILFLVKFCSKSFRTKNVKLLGVFWLSSFFVWLYASEVFFAPFDKDFILSLPYVSQFRSIGRFGVLFYYLVGATGIYILYYLWSRKNMSLNILVVLLTITWGAEAYFNHEGLRSEHQITMEGAFYDRPVFHLDSLLTSYNRNLNDYQCSLILPIATNSNFGSEHAGGFFTLHYATRLRIESGLPAITSLSTRGANNHGIGVCQLLSTYPSEKILLPYLNDKKILLQYPENEEELSDANKRLLKVSTFIGKGNNCLFSEINKEDFNRIKDTISPMDLIQEQNNKIPITKKFIEKEKYYLASYTRTDTSKGLKIKFKTSLEPERRIASYWFIFFDAAGNFIWKAPMPFNPYDFEGLSNINHTVIEAKHLHNVHTITLYTNELNEQTNQLSIYEL